MNAARDHIPLRPADQVMYRGDKESRARTGMCMVEVYDRVPDWDHFLQTWERASRIVPRLRQRVVEPALPTTMARWIVDPDFDLRYHVRRRSLAGDGSHQELLDVAEEIAMTPLDAHRPLWTMTLVSGLKGGKAASVFSASHSMGDVSGMVAMFEPLYDTQRMPGERPMPPAPEPDRLGSGDLAIEGLKEMPSVAFDLARDAAEFAVKKMVRPVGNARAATSYLLSLRRTAGSLAAVRPSPLLARRGASRRCATLDVDLETLRAAADALGGTINDAYVAAVCGVMRLYHEAKGEPVERMPFGIPVNLRRKGDELAEGNHWTGLGLGAPIGETDPAARVAAIHAAVSSGRKGPTRSAVKAATAVMSVMPTTLMIPAMYSVPAMDVQATNMRFYPGETYLGGAKVIGQYGLGPVPGVAVMVAMLTRRGRAFICARYDTASIDDHDLFYRCLREGFDEVLALGDPPPAPKPKPAKKATRPRRTRT